MNELKDLLYEQDLWSKLSSSTKPLFLYGMGDGADKILDVCLNKNIKVSGVFASDEFVRGQSFRGFTVKTYAQVKQVFQEITILVSFATRLENVLNKIYALSNTDELYAPDVPVFGTGLFDSKYFADNFEKFDKVYSLLSDETSKKAYYNILKYKISGDIRFLAECETSPAEAYNTIICPKDGSVYADIGAYNGDTIREYSLYAGKNITAYAFEPDARNFKKLCENVSSLGISQFKPFNIAAWNRQEQLIFYSRSGRNSAHTTAHKGLKQTVVEADRADRFIDKSVDYINIDAEGSDLEALEGLHETISHSKPVVSCAVYHKNEDMFSIPLYLYDKYSDIYSDFGMYIRHFPYIPGWDTNVYIKNKQ